MQYNVLKDFEGHTAGEIIDGNNTTLQPLEIAAFITDGTLDPIVNEDDYEDVVVDQAFLDANPDAVAAGVELGATIQVPKTETSEEAEVVDDEQEEEDDKVEVEETAYLPENVTPSVALVYNGQEVVSNGIREVNGIEYHSLRLADGTTTDVTDEEYETMVNGQ